MSTETTKTTDDTKFKLKNVRLSFPHLFSPQQSMDGGKAKYSADFILDRVKHKDLIASLEKGIERVALDKFKKKITLKSDKVCLHDGNDKQDKDGYGDDVMYIVAKNDRTFPIVDKDPSIPVTDASNRIYGGCYVNAIVRLFAYDNPKGGKGVSASLEAVQFCGDGPSFGAARVNAEDEFEVENDGL